MFINNKTPNTITQSQPDLQEYQDFFNHEDPRRNRSVTLYDRHKKDNSNHDQKLQLSSNLQNLSLTKTTYNNLKTIYQFTKKTLTQINQKQEITLSQNFVTSIKESNLFMYNVAQKISTFIKTDKIAVVPPHKIIGNWMQQLKSKCLKKKSPQNSQYPNNNTGQRDEDDDLIII
ncbi:unnamed protein product (macronuclear) [Paramecium tetraurelia]|uniref:Uncharacterized protein n=1 Tax=Paramecium tetraurelia TaxID=5888 RepID=A0CX23_PARTE|nr:uncharacterized protein GSPATT00001543001 [Paramecium tetraurelia]CAK75340.1 unnamed protein product [Paramecium tetraurelia]|eukprot:XP_001442737.1 hypothetical protein (macronuclear) [Paramecium tetraurelia strain d4-2]